MKESPRAQPGGSKQQAIFLTCCPADDDGTGSGGGRHALLSASAAALALLGLPTCPRASQDGSVRTSLQPGQDLRSALLASGDERAQQAWAQLERQLAAGQEAAARLPVGRRWLQLTAMPMPSGHVAWEAEVCESPDAAAPAAQQTAQAAPQQQQDLEHDEEPPPPPAEDADDCSQRSPACSCCCGGGAAAAAPAAVPPQLAALCNQALASTSESVEILAPVVGPGGPTIVWANSAHERLTGYRQKEVVGRGHSFLQGPDTDPVTLAEIEEALREGRPVSSELLVYRADGTPFWSHVSITPIRDAAGAVANFVAVQRDVSSRKAAEAAVQMRERALANLNEGICISDATKPDCPLVYVNQAFERITGYSRREVIGRNCRFLQGPKTDPAAVARLGAALHEGREVTVELLNYKKSGEEFYNLLSCTPVRDGAGRLLSFIGVQSDITELVRRRHAEAELQEAKVAAETAAEAKSMFLANMSHEIRTPLNGMIAVAQLLLGSGLTPEQRELADTILESGNTLLGILGDILDFSKIDHNSMVLESAPLALRDTVESALELVSAEAGRKGLDLAYCLAPPLAGGRRLLGDSIRIRQVLANLLSNAVKFTPSGEVVVDAWLEEPSGEGAPAAPGAAADGSSPTASPPSRLLHMTVRDSGIGISPEAAANLFQCFRQGHESMTRRYGGTGLGLVISRRLAHLMGGDVWVVSAEGEGSTFHFTAVLLWEGEEPPAPAADAPAAATAAAVTAAPAAAAPARADATSIDSQPPSDRSGESAQELPKGLQRSRDSLDSELSPTAQLASMVADGSQSATDSGADSAESGPGAEQQRQLLQAHHEALLHKLRAQGELPGGRDAPPSVARASDLPSRLSESASEAPTDAPDTPALGAPHAAVGMSHVSSCSRLSVRTGSSSALAALTSLAAAAVQRMSGSRRGSDETVRAAGSRQERPSSDSLARSSGDPRRSGTSPRPPRPAPPPAADFRSSSFFSPSAPLAQPRPPTPTRTPAPEAGGAHKGRQGGAGVLPPPPVPVDFRSSSFFATSMSVGPETRPGSAEVHRPASPPSPTASELAAHRAASAPAQRPREVAAAAVVALQASGSDGRNSRECAVSSASAPLARGSADLPGTSPGASPPARPETAVLTGRSVCIDVAHLPTAVQLSQSCTWLGMVPTLGPCALMAPPLPPGGDDGASPCFCITTADKALEAVRGGWRGQPLVVLGSREDLPLNLQPLATTVSKPVKHARLVAALLKAAAFSRSRQSAPLHSDPQMLSLLPERLAINRLASRGRISLDNSALDRRRWEAAAVAAAAAAAAAGQGTLEPVRSSAPPAPGRGVAPSSASASASGAAVEQLETTPLDAGRRSVDGLAGGSGGWRPQLACIDSDSGGEGSHRSSLDLFGGACGSHASMASIPEASPAAAQQAAAAEQQQALPERLLQAAPPPQDLRILVAEDNLINQRVIRKVLQRVVPGAAVEVVGDGAQALAAALAARPPFDLVLMDIHMPQMDGLEASRRLREELPPGSVPVIVALSADTLQMQDDKRAAAGFAEFIVKPFRVEDVERTIALVQPRPPAPAP